jgi:hypothetical protein
MKAENDVRNARRWRQLLKWISENKVTKSQEETKPLLNFVYEINA